MALGLLCSFESPEGLGKGEFGPAILSLQGNDQLQLSFFGQLRFQVVDPDGQPAGTSFVLNRVRPVLKARFLDQRLRFKLHLNLGPTAPELLDFLVDYQVTEGLHVRLGQMKLPLDLYRVSSISRLNFPDWSRAARFFGGERQIGLMVHNAFAQGLERGLEWAAGVYSGTNARNAFERGVAQVYGVDLPNPSNLADPATPARLHPELVGRVGAHFGRDPWTGDSDLQGGPPRVRFGLGTAWDLDPRAGRDFALRLHPEVLFKAYHLSASLQGYVGFFDPVQGSGMEVGALGMNAQAAWRCFPFLEAAVRSTHIRVLDAMRQDAIRADLPNQDLADGEDAVEVVPSESQDELTLGLNLYVVGHSLKWMNDVSWIWLHEGSSGRQDVRFRSQFQLMF